MTQEGGPDSPAISAQTPPAWFLMTTLPSDDHRRAGRHAMRRNRRAIQGALCTTAMACMLLGCAPASDSLSDPGESVLEAPINPADVKPCGAPLPGYNVIHGSGKIVGTDGPDWIYGSDGKDEIFGGKGDDVICGQGGDDTIDGGFGQDIIDGADGDDIIHGRSEGDWIHGGRGNDHLYGDILDDHLFGDEGDDVLIGGHGVDWMDGGPGNDWLRGDTNGDSFIGGDGDDDVASFTTAMPPGQGGGVSGIFLENGRAVGDGVTKGLGEPLDGIERVIGSSFDDSLSGPYTIEPGLGDDSCNGASCGAGPNPTGGASIYAFVDDHEKDSGFVILGTPQADDIRLTWDDASKKLTIAVTGAITPGAHCSAVDAKTVTCHSPHPVRYLLAWGDGGEDSIDAHGQTFPNDLTTQIDGGPNSDHLQGSEGQDVLFTGQTGNDLLEGNAGDDALISESPNNTLYRKGGLPYDGGSDTLLAGDGDDQIVSDYPCGGHVYDGGNGIDIAGFARSSAQHRIVAQLGGGGEHKTFLGVDYHGLSFQPELCDPGQGTRIHPDLEILEGAGGDDILAGDDGWNVIWGREGNDVLMGLGGNDQLMGHEGNDEIYGGTGKDVLDGGGGYDHLYAADGEADVINCGEGGGVLETADSHDPKGNQCTAANPNNACAKGTECWCKQGDNYKTNACGKYGKIAGTLAFCKQYPNNAKCSGNGGSSGSSGSSSSGGGYCDTGTECWCKLADHYKDGVCANYKNIAGTHDFCVIYPHNAKCDDRANIPGTKAFCQKYPNSKYC